MSREARAGSTAGELASFISELSSARSMAEVMAAVAHAVRDLLDADGATFVLREDDRCFYAEEDAISPLWKGRRFPMRACISGWCMLHAQPAAIPDIYSDPRIPADAYRPTFVRSLAMAPVRRDRPMAALGAYWSHTREIRAEEVELLQAIADATALSVAYLELRDAKALARPAVDAAPAAAAPSEPAPDTASPAGGLAGLARQGLRPGSPAAYAFAAFCVAAATGLRLGADALGVAGVAPFVTFLPAVVVATIAGGARAGAAAAILSGLLAEGLILQRGFPPAPPQASSLLNLGLFLAASGFTIWTLDRYRRAVTTLRREDARRMLLSREIQHRNRNLAAVVQAIVAQSLRGEPETARVINERIRMSVKEIDPAAPAANAPADVRGVLAAELAPFDLRRFEFRSEEDLPLSSRDRSVLALAAHELATNAVKHGALSAEHGKVVMEWWIEGSSRELRWTEMGGPAVEPPRRRGYGSGFLHRLLDGAGGSIAIDYRRAGIVAAISLPLETASAA